MTTEQLVREALRQAVAAPGPIRREQDRWRPSSGHWEGRRWELWVDCVYMRCRVISQGELGWEAVACSTGLGYFRTGPEAARACERWAGLL
jgi:hypothetical protein